MKVEHLIYSLMAGLMITYLNTKTFGKLFKAILKIQQIILHHFGIWGP